MKKDAIAAEPHLTIEGAVWRPILSIAVETGKPETTQRRNNSQLQLHHRIRSEHLESDRSG